MANRSDKGRKLTTKLAGHILNEVALRDPLTGECLPQSLHGVLDAIWQTCREGAIPLPNERLTQIAELCTEPMRRILHSPRTALHRGHKMLPFHRIKELDRKSMRWAGRQPGRNFREKMANRRTALGPVREFSQETLENQLTGLLARHLERELQTILENANQYESDPASKQKERQCRKLYELSGQARRQFGGQTNHGARIAPNNVLLSDTNYSRIWRGWQWLQHCHIDEEQASLERESRFRTAAFWTIAARLSQSKNTRLIDRPCRISDGFMNRPYAILQVSGEQWSSLTNLQFLWYQNKNRKKEKGRCKAGGVITLALEGATITLTYETLSGTTIRKTESARSCTYKLQMAPQTIKPKRGMGNRTRRTS